MDIGRVRLSKGWDFFCFRAPREAFGGLVGPAPNGRPAVRTVILDLQRRDKDVTELRVGGAPIRVIPFPEAHRVIVRVLTGSVSDRPQECLEALLPRRTFDQLAGGQGASRLRRLDLESGVAADDGVLRHLGASLEHALTSTPTAPPRVVDQITTSLTVRIAQHYGDLHPTPAPQRGGLTAWQLRLAWAAFDRHLDSPISLDALARECGLSVSHFSRAFRRSTGLTPHRWLMRRRIEAAKDMMMAGPTPLAEVALACGFADQSHFTRTFASLIGLTPARWRTDQERRFAFS